MIDFNVAQSVLYVLLSEFDSLNLNFFIDKMAEKKIVKS